jgi:hypothetical protein
MRPAAYRSGSGQVRAQVVAVAQEVEAAQFGVASAEQVALAEGHLVVLCRLACYADMSVVG